MHQWLQILVTFPLFSYSTPPFSSSIYIFYSNPVQKLAQRSRQYWNSTVAQHYVNVSPDVNILAKFPQATSSVQLSRTNF